MLGQLPGNHARRFLTPGNRYSETEKSPGNNTLRFLNFRYRRKLLRKKNCEYLYEIASNFKKMLGGKSRVQKSHVTVPLRCIK